MEGAFPTRPMRLRSVSEPVTPRSRVYPPRVRGAVAYRLDHVATTPREWLDRKSFAL